MKKLKFILLLLLQSSILIKLKADEIKFSSDLLFHAVEVLECQQQLDTLPEGSSIIELTSGAKVRVGKRGGRLVHIGSPLFSDLLYTEQPLIYDYLEFAMLDHIKHISDNPYLFKNLRFQKGGWNQMERVTPETPCSVSTQEGQIYEVEWLLPDSSTVCITVPIEYDRLAMMSRQELEMMFLEDLQMGNNAIRPTISLPEQLFATDEPGIFVQKGSSFIIPNINQNVYFLQDEDAFVLVCDTIYPAQTMANFINADSDEMPMIMLDLSVSLYDYQKVSTRVYLSDLLTYCKNQGCIIYWGLESLDESKMMGSLYLVNNSTSYCHIIRIQAETAQFLQQNGVIKGKASLFTPLSNIANLYEEKTLKKQNQKKQIQK